jgi:hypothetical protein
LLLWPQKFEAMNRPTIANFQDDLRMGLWHLNWHHSDETDPVPFSSRHITVFDDQASAVIKEGKTA